MYFAVATFHDFLKYYFLTHAQWILCKTLRQNQFKWCTCSYILFLYTVYLILFSYKSMSSFSCVQRLFSKTELVKTMLLAQLKQTNLENQLFISTESPKEGFNDTVLQHFLDELKHCNLDMRMDLQLLVPVFIPVFNY